ncbi:Phosphatidylinositol-4-phosphate 5-kinase [Elasticomyces elasticus]|uniref:Phosphatidylinositol-4-phosphate 5-kinase n=1 Tax=Exophiala sideris TaxID=1016849 RepID=A0ABR0J8L4_9EURO|nr:Phosphatidylinositol-4-phosphate 5-kinase [Elasticomyces elasticus]KAK5027987.1 Phosphatidylinositol-4-phosphate 5-kinase [Exophiala sideris]KAK5037422.1 Phosphatidylinositol-4-phosphate 5-kinase [Exophiala sideris]KAK5059084.1 Phosphatidylinositol-4-phosphate 5-kinase [Exophiala sideris]KAK5182917.1 Phosphatidylinositol-4-phosphate 5-kinase [Eurotiomycetes sp. CCFEE 6388]
MPTGPTDPSPSLIPNSANVSSADGPLRKSHDKTIGGVFTYTNSADIESGYSERRLDQIRNHANNSHTSLTNGLPNGNVKATTRDRAQSKAGSTHSIGSATARHSGHLSKNSMSVDGMTRLSSVENVSDERSNGVPTQPGGHTPELGRLKTDLPSRQPEYDPYHMVTASTMPDTARSDGQLLSLQPPRGAAPALARFSSPPAMSPGASIQDRHPDPAQPSEPPKLSHRHTLQVPKSNLSRNSRDFSFSAGPSEEALSTSGRFSPTRDQYDSSVPRHRRASLGLVRRTTRSMLSDGHPDDVPPDEDAARWTELIKQKRASRRKRKEEEEDDDRVIVGKKVEEGHVNWVIAYNMLTGIRFTVSRTNAKMDRQLTDADFDAKHKFSFDITGNELTPSAKYDFKFKDYAPWVFRHLRSIFGLDPADYLMSLTSKYILSELGSPGKSGSFFYFSRDYKYIIKTIHHSEHKLLRKILRDYYQHVVDNPNTLISQFYGLHRVKIPYGRKTHFVVMNNLFPPHRDIHHMFDLKGSTVGRDFREEDLVNNPRATLKDLNWLRRDLHLEFNMRIRQIFLDQLKKDVALLQRLHIMDYSLLVGIHDMTKGNEENLRETTLQVFQPGGEKEEDGHGASMLTRTPSRMENAKKARELRLTLKKERPVPMGKVQAKMPSEMASGDERHDRIFYSYDGGIRATHEDGRGGESIYYLGVIDCLTHYGTIKRIEHFWKGMSAPRTQISAVPAQQYGERFLNFITGVTMTREEAERRKTEESRRSGVQTSALSMDSQREAYQSGSITEHGTSMSPAVEKTMQKAQKQTDKATPAGKGRSESEDEKPERTLRTAEDSRSASLLPVVAEAGESSSQSSRKRALSPADERPEYDSELSTSPPPMDHSIPGLRKVSPSTIGTASDMADDTSLSSPQVADFEHSTHTDGDSVPEYDIDRTFDRRPDKPPRLGSDLIQPYSPLSESLMQSIHEHMGDGH